MPLGYTYLTTILANVAYLLGRTTAGVLKKLIGMDASNVIVVGDSTNAANLELAAGGGTKIVLNEAGLDVDVRIESDTNPNLFVCDAGVFAGGGAVTFGVAIVSNPNAFFGIRTLGGYPTPANQSYGHLIMQTPAGAVTVPAGTSPIVATAIFQEPNITAVGTVPDAYTVVIETAPTEGTRNGSLWVKAGQVRFDGLPTSAAGLPSGTLWNNAGVVNVVP